MQLHWHLFRLLCFIHLTWIQVDFKPVIQELLATHPGLEFLKGTPEFQERYGIAFFFFEIGIAFLLEM